MEEINMQNKPKVVSIVDFKIKIWAKQEKHHLSMEI